MAEYIEREATIASIENVLRRRTDENSLGYLAFSMFAELIKIAPTADVVEVVRCKDCEDYNGHRYCEYHAVPVLDDDFCSYGHKEEGAGK